MNEVPIDQYFPALKALLSALSASPRANPLFLSYSSSHLLRPFVELALQLSFAAQAELVFVRVDVGVLGQGHASADPFNFFTLGGGKKF